MKKLLLAMALLLLTFGPSQASTLGIDFGLGFAAFNDVNNYVLGWEFSVSTPITVVALGAADLGKNGFLQPQQVGLWTASGTLLASVFVNGNDSLTSWWRFANITPVTLSAGENYIVASQGGEGYAYNALAKILTPGVNYVTDRWHLVGNTSNDPLKFPENSNNTVVMASFFGGNFMADAVPVPPTVLLLGSGLLGLAGLRRFRKS